VNPNAELRYTPALTAPESNGESAPEGRAALIGFDEDFDEEEEDEDGEAGCAGVCARTGPANAIIRAPEK